MSHSLPDLPYDYSALEPHIDARTMEIHHSKHHQTYVNKLNEAEEKLKEALSKNNAAGVAQLTSAINFNAGGHANHSLFWSVMKKAGGGEPSGVLGDAIQESFGSFAAFQKHFNATTAVIQGSGWGWLCYSPVTKKVVFQTTANQDHPTKLGLVPLLGIDVWEHAYYLKYQNRRPDYLGAWWNVVNWDRVSENFTKARG
ncbi:MAG: superoxide dismutase [Planctomycetota bacterium]